MIYLIGAIIAFYAFKFLKNAYLGNQDIEHVKKSGGLKIKYSTLINKIMSNEKLNLYEKNINNIEIGYNFIGNGYVRFKLIEMSRVLVVGYEQKDNINDVRKFAWKFGENDNQDKMFEQIAMDLFICNLTLSGYTVEEAKSIYYKNKNS